MALPHTCTVRLCFVNEVEKMRDVASPKRKYAKTSREFQNDPLLLRPDSGTAINHPLTSQTIEKGPKALKREKREDEIRRGGWNGRIALEAESKVEPTR